MSGVRRANCDCCDVDIWCCYEDRFGSWICEEISQEDCKGYGGTSYETEVLCDADCAEPDCTSPISKTIPTSCPSSGCTTWQVSNQCFGEECDEMFAEISAEISLHYGTDITCDCDADPCTFELEACVGTWNVGGTCFHVMNDCTYQNTTGQGCPDPGGADLSVHVSRPSSFTVDDATPFDGLIITFDEDDAGTNLTASGNGDIAKVTAQSDERSQSILINYIFANGVCWEYSIPTYFRRDTGCAIDCINSQTDASSSSLGLTATGTSTLITYGIVDSAIQRIDGGGNSATIQYYKPPKGYFETIGYFHTSPDSCEIRGNCHPGWQSCLGFSASTTDFYQRINTTQAWGGTATCAYNYTWAVDSTGSGGYDCIDSMSLLIDSS